MLEMAFIQLFSIGFIDIGFLDIIDILLVGFLIYQLYKLVTGSIAVRIFGGLLSLYLVYLLVKAAKMQLLTAILGQFIGVGVLALIIVFQQEIRKFLLLVGKNSMIHKNIYGFRDFFGKGSAVKKMDFTQVIEAAKSMAGSNTGGIIIFSRSTPMKFFAESGDEMDAKISKRLLLAIFNKNSPLHDGAVIIHEDRIRAARCILPVSENQDISPNLGLRHRAAIGITEITDSLVLVVSEETGQISLSFDGNISTNLSTAELRFQLNSIMNEQQPKKMVHDEDEEESVPEIGKRSA